MNNLTSKQKDYIEVAKLKDNDNFFMFQNSFLCEDEDCDYFLNK